MPATRRRRALGLLAAASVLLTGCGDLGNAASAQGLARNDLVGEMATRLTSAATLSYTARYNLLRGATGTITQGQKPRRIAYDYPDGRLVVSEQAVTDCRGGKRPCAVTGPPGGGAQPPALDRVQQAGLVAPATVLALLNAAALDRTAAAVKLRDTTIAGHHATCLDVSGMSGASARSFAACVTGNGVLGSFKGTLGGTPVDMTMTELDPAADATGFDAAPPARKAGPSRPVTAD